MFYSSAVERSEPGNVARVAGRARKRDWRKMTPQTVPKQAFGFFVEEMEDENLLYRLGGHKAIHLNDTATVIWKLCDGSRTVEDIINLLAREYPGSETAVAADVREAIELLVSEGALLEVRGVVPAEAGSPSPGTAEPR